MTGLFVLKSVIGIVAVLLTFAGYVPYVQDIFKGLTKPHIYSWFLWGFVTAIAFALQISDSAGIGSFVTLAAALMCLLVCVLSTIYAGQKDIAAIDTVFLVLAFIALAIWLFAKQPVLSVLLAAAIDLLGFAPTVRKSWNQPYSETISFYFLNTLRFSLALFSLQRYTIITACYPTVWLLANGLFAVMLLARRRRIVLKVTDTLQEELIS